MSKASKKTSANANKALASAQCKEVKKGVIECADRAELVDELVTLKVGADRAALIYKSLEEIAKTAARKAYTEHKGSDTSVVMKGKIHEFKIVFKQQFSALPYGDKDSVRETLVTYYTDNSELLAEDETPEAAAEALFNELFEDCREIKMVDTSDASIDILTKSLKFSELLSLEDLENMEEADLRKTVVRFAKEIKSAKRQGGQTAFEDLFQVKRTLGVLPAMAQKQFELPEAITDKLKQTAPSATIAAAEIAKVSVADAIKAMTEKLSEKDEVKAAS